MIHRSLKIGRWEVDFLFVKDKYDVESISTYLYFAGASKIVLEQAEDLMWMCEYNSGFTFANEKRHRAVVVIGPTTSGAEFQDTLIHELHHLAVAIAASLGVDLESETPAYVAGDAARDLADVICRLGCSNCDGR